MTYNSQHHTFVIDRVVKASPALVFHAFATEEGKSQWFAAPEGEWTLIERQFDFREGGSERLRGRWIKSGVVSDFQCCYHDIVRDSRICYSYDMFVGEKRISVSLVTITFTPMGDDTHLTLTEQVAHFDGYPTPEDRETGTAFLIDKAISYIEAVPA
ncbi:MAG: SRPBCC family protein [Asticcacaulis sp.]